MFAFQLPVWQFLYFFDEFYRCIEVTKYKCRDAFLAGRPYANICIGSFLGGERQLYSSLLPNAPFISPDAEPVVHRRRDIFTHAILIIGIDPLWNYWQQLGGT